MDRGPPKVSLEDRFSRNLALPSKTSGLQAHDISLAFLDHIGAFRREKAHRLRFDDSPYHHLPDVMAACRLVRSPRKFVRLRFDR